MKFTEDKFDELFNYATSARESTLEFCANEISGKEWLNILYNKDTKKIVKQMFSKFGVAGTRTKMRRLVGKFSWMGDYKD